MNRLARAPQVYEVCHAPLKNARSPARAGVRVWLWRSIHCPPSYQSEPRVGTTISSVETSLASYKDPSGAVLRSCAYRPARPASTSASLGKKFDDVRSLGAGSVRSVQPCTGRSSSAANPAVPSDMGIENLFMGSGSLEQKAQAAGNRAGPRVSEVIETACRQTVRGVDLGVETRITGQQNEVIRGHVHARTAGRARQHRQVQGISDRDGLQPQERSILDPLGRENRGLVNSRRIVQRVAQEVLVLERVALRPVDQGRVVEHVLSHRGADQEADVEVIPVDLAVEAEREIGVRVAEDAVISLGRSLAKGRPAIDAADRRRRAGVHLLAVRVDADEQRPVECADRLALDEPL